VICLKQDADGRGTGAYCMSNNSNWRDRPYSVTCVDCLRLAIHMTWRSSEETRDAARARLKEIGGNEMESCKCEGAK